MSVTDPDYIHETRDSLEQRITELAQRASEARAEARHAREHPGLAGPAANALAAAAEVEGEIADLREVAIRVDRGYPWWDRHGFELALEAYGEPWRWQDLSESVTGTFVYSNDDIDVRLPVDVQRTYGRAFETSFFNRFEICEWYETEGDCVVATRSFIFGIQDFPRLGACSFLVAEWDR